MDFSELVTEVQQRSGITDVASRASHYVRTAERMLEKRLKVGAMERIADVISDGDGVVTLPADFLQLRTAGEGVVSGPYLLTGARAAAFPLQYYATLTPLEDGPNWISESEPELYIQAVLFQVYTANGMPEPATATLALLNAMIAQIEDADTRARHMHRRIDIRRLMP